MELAEKIKTPLLEEVQPTPVVRRNLYDPFKRLFDFCFAILILPIFLPVMALIIVLIKLDSKGSLIFSHKRVGKGGRLFSCYKFRTMVENAEDLLGEVLKDHEARQEWKKDFKLRDDPRITGIGKFLRKFSFDELPQIFNVLKGDMSFVGPRPIVEEEINKYGSDIKYYQDVRPGITGLWQINGRNDTDYFIRVRLDKNYILNRSISLDMRIVIKTFPAVLSRRGSY